MDTLKDLEFGQAPLFLEHSDEVNHIRLKVECDLVSMFKGMLWGFLSYVFWGFFPLYWKLLSSRPAIQTLSHRIVWSFVFYLILFLFFSKEKWNKFLQIPKKEYILLVLASAALTLNWGLYIYAVNTGKTLEGSLAYFINPLLNILVGLFFFKEKIPKVLQLALTFAFLGVSYKIFSSNEIPWISFILALSFCLYGVFKKMLKESVLVTSVIESGLVLIPAIFGVLYFQYFDLSTFHSGTVSEGLFHFSNFSSWQIWLLFIGGGVVTGLPLFLFSFATQRVPYSLMGVLQFIAPTLQFCVAIFLFKEAFSDKDLISFSLIWFGLLFYLFHKLHQYRLSRN